MILGKASKAKLVGVHPDLVKVVERAIEITPIDFRVICGTRTREEQMHLVSIGASKTMKSRHIPDTSRYNPGYAHAVDVVALDGGKVSWHGPLYFKIAKAMKMAAKELKTPLEWGGECFGPRFFDGPHFQLPWKDYP